MKNGLSETEQAGLELIYDQNGIYQSEFWKELDISSRQGSRIVTTLLDEELIKREETAYNGRVTYFLTPTAKLLDFSLLMAGDLISPFIGESETNPQSAEFSSWIMRLR
ncbi:helix-turn-helix transcriptional regulator [Halegenticoccus soli]|uniref:helix-turn-helix transcriptional regulator n=1 Tax=Halegenticoccus soli TaxID=1985678 RepID=UPI000C6E9C10|nr:MarR family transcriptional regulator [Halegenticoccus soli]